MAMVLFDDQLLSSEEMIPLLNNRGFLYGDGFFETLSIRHAHVFFIEAHFERATKAFHTLALEQEIKNSQNLFTLIQKIWEANGKPQFATVKWMVWRNSEGLYEPTENKSNNLLELKPYREAVEEKNNVGIVEQIKNVQSIQSGFKTLSSLHYVLAGLEKKQQQVDDILLLDQHDHVSEALSSSFFWIYQDALYTPSLDTGCIEGITRKKILSLAKQWNIGTHEVKIPWTNIPVDATIFTSNIGGLSRVTKIKGTSFKQDAPLFARLKDELFNPSSGQNLETAN